MASSRFATEGEFILPSSFPDEEHRCEDRVQRQDQIAKVRAEFEQAKQTPMSRQALAEIFDYLKRGEWIHPAERASAHPAYRRFMGKSSYNGGVPTLYYPEFLVVQAIFPQDRDNPDIHVAVRKLYETVSKHWGMKAIPGIPFFPRLQDSDRELRLLVGNHPIRSKTVGRSDPFLTTPLASRPSPRPEVQESSFQNTQDNVLVSPSAPSTSSNSARPAPNPPSGLSPYLAGINMKFTENEQRIADLERKLKEKEQEVKDKDFQMDNLGYKQRYEQALEQTLETQRALRDTRQRCRELEMLLNKYEEKSKQLKHLLLQSREHSNRSLTAVLQSHGLLGLGQQQLDQSLSLLSEPIDEFNATPEGSGFDALDQRANKRSRET
ncbi:uncharacterized protein FSUBG_101 [Fusarium subglutinans]|uniref:Uncharacterized protein n=1 Tax=Gibberella subglutinans TaxID=42677 RepID=A0A8H5V8A7_GIBSU|nr:uncharacterized protein FSUBG_101 [Fusarium subglutinans]KAF5614221.1 hypothetical protein FSUBG_101 [Fusarium subglutinans]